MPSLTKKQLVQVVTEFNDVMALDPPIKKTNPNAKLEADIKEAAEELQDTDEFSPEVEKVLVRLGIRETIDDLKKDKEEPKDEPTKKAAGKKKAEAKSASKAKKAVPATTFICHLICDNPDISTEEIQKRLDKKGYKAAASTISTVRTDLLKGINYLIEKGRLSY
jgi:hypothetical protein